MDSRSSSRPSSMAIPVKRLTTKGPYCVRRPKLDEILDNKASPPWTLSAFMAYLSQAHCLEILEFTMDAKRYRKHYNKACSRSSTGCIEPGSEEETFIRALWLRLIEAYIAPNGPREVNIPGDIRDEILRYNKDSRPPQPCTLDPAVATIMELMEDSVLVPFLNSLSPNISMEQRNVDVDMIDADDFVGSASTLVASQSVDERHFHRSSRRTTQKVAASPPPSTSPTASSNRASASSHGFPQLARSFVNHSRYTLSPSHASTSSPFDTPYPTTSSTTSFSNPTSARNSAVAITPFADAFNFPRESRSTAASTSSKAPSPALASVATFSSTTYVEHRQQGSRSSRSSLPPISKADIMTPPTTPPMCEISDPGRDIEAPSVATMTTMTSDTLLYQAPASPRTAAAFSGITHMFHGIQQSEQGMPEQAPHPYTSHHHTHVSFQTPSLDDYHSRRTDSQGSLEPALSSSPKDGGGLGRSVMMGNVTGAGLSSVSVNSSLGGASSQGGSSVHGMSTWKRVRTSFFGGKK